MSLPPDRGAPLGLDETRPPSEVKGAGQLPSAVPHVPCTLAGVCAGRDCEERAGGPHAQAASSPSFRATPGPCRTQEGPGRRRSFMPVTAPRLLLLSEGPACFFWVDKGSSSGGSPTLRPKKPTPSLRWQNQEMRDTETTPTEDRCQFTLSCDAPHPAHRRRAPAA